jgi:hypothetical protein
VGVAKKGETMKLLVCLLLMVTFIPGALGQVIATCKDPAGYANYHHNGLISKRDAGFSKDKISGGITTIQRLENGEYDILFIDTRKQIISTKNDGGTILLMRHGKKDATFLSMYPGRVIELYTVYTDSDGINRFDILTSKGGDAMPIHKSSIMSGVCTDFNLQVIK